MFEYLLRWTIYRGLDHRAQKVLIKLTSTKYIIYGICTRIPLMICMFLHILIIMACYYTGHYYNLEFEASVPTIVVSGLCLYLVGSALSRCSNYELTWSRLTEKIYFVLCTKKGKAISKKDFKLIKKKNDFWYEAISTQECRGYCYNTCFKILEMLKKGYIEIIGIRKFIPEQVGRKYMIHVLYINNGWAFDTYSSKQVPVEELHRIYDAKIYRTFNFDDIEGKSYDDFRRENEKHIEEWCSNNDCDYFVRM